MKILVLSDTHESRYWKVFLQTFNFNGYDYIFHLGDNYSDIYDIEPKTTAKIVAVPGLWRKEYQDPRIENVKYIELNGVIFILSHVEAEGRVLYNGGFFMHLFGHTHNYTVQMREGHIVLNPGHIKNSIDRGCEASYGEIILEEDFIKCYIKSAKDSVLIKKKIINR